MVGPAQAERKVRLAGLQDLVDRTLKDAAATEPVVVIAKALDAVLACQIGLRLPRLGQAQIVEAQVRRHVGLVVIWKKRQGLGRVGPLGEALAPPDIVFRGG